MSNFVKFENFDKFVKIENKCVKFVKLDDFDTCIQFDKFVELAMTWVGGPIISSHALQTILVLGPVNKYVYRIVKGYFIMPIMTGAVKMSVKSSSLPGYRR